MPPPDRPDKPPKAPKAPKDTLKSPHVLQLLAAPGWFAECLTEDGTVSLLPLAGWTTLADGEIVGLIARDRVEYCPEVEGFQRYWKED
jgi:hypothetical protein